MRITDLSKLILIALLFFSFPVMGNKSCPVINLQEDFNPARYMGVWYEQMRDKKIKFEKFDCVHAKYTLLEDNTVTVYNAQFNDIKNEIDSVKGTATFKGANGRVKFHWFIPSGDYRVVSTDYDSYAVVYSCENFLWYKMQAAWILTREKNPSQELVKKAFEILKERVPSYKWEDFHQTKQGENCKYADFLRVENN